MTDAEPQRSTRGTALGTTVARTGSSEVDIDGHVSSALPDSPHTAQLLADMTEVLDRCVWSQSMTHESLITYLVEESYELVDAIEEGDPQAMLEELGDVLWQVVFHAEIAARTAGENFSFDDVARVAHEKVVRRHPHVFGEEFAPTLDDVFRVWSAAKAREKSTRTSALDGIPAQLPALALADKVIGRATRAGVLAPTSEAAGAASMPGAPDAVATVSRDARSRTVADAATGTDADAGTDAVAGQSPDADANETALGDQLLAIVRDAHERGLDAERALRLAVRRLSAEVREREQG
ncbi:MazG nucleotide pyrophosphohydrolase domain-containing protein [Microbacterium sp. MPKO10]|uniref:MazG nucleotide pyrophosphohydrolase domain-containing protein n=1 Tax=Microbacterium sp. MPKO10 TaxID=2989818 RepID=UPI002236BA81|nr:MazG nucleotide pyrophosphohydrolase domain-containing protein [Microbacterium sp. MPKO10]MCW4457925.1 nucleoside triphosphate pyrophosphohydrolase [Microbacterium sp. MPKO10]